MPQCCRHMKEDQNQKEPRQRDMNRAIVEKIEVSRRDTGNGQRQKDSVEQDVIYRCDDTQQPRLVSRARRCATNDSEQDTQRDYAENGQPPESVDFVKQQIPGVRFDALIMSSVRAFDRTRGRQLDGKNGNHQPMQGLLEGSVLPGNGSDPAREPRYVHSSLVFRRETAFSWELSPGSSYPILSSLSRQVPDQGWQVNKAGRHLDLPTLEGFMIHGVGVLKIIDDALGIFVGSGGEPHWTGMWRGCRARRP